MKALITTLFVFALLTVTPAVRAQTISLNLIASVEPTATHVNTTPVKVFTTEDGVVIRDYTVVSSNQQHPVASKTRTVVTATATVQAGGYGMRARPQPIRRLFGGLFRGRLGRLGCSY
jgi:heme-binding NEAT domain protein